MKKITLLACSALLGFQSTVSFAAEPAEKISAAEIKAFFQNATTVLSADDAAGIKATLSPKFTYSECSSALHTSTDEAKQVICSEKDRQEYTKEMDAFYAKESPFVRDHYTIEILDIRYQDQYAVISTKTTDRLHMKSEPEKRLGCDTLGTNYLVKSAEGILIERFEGETTCFKDALRD